MAEGYREPETQQEVSLPIDVKTLIKALLQKKWWLLITVVLSVCLGVAAALLLGTQTFEATTVLYYQPVASALSDQFIVNQSLDADTTLSYQQGAQLTKRDDDGMNLKTLINMVEIVPNFERLRDELDLEMSLEQIGSAIYVTTAKETNLMLIHATAEDRELAALIANKIRDIFLENIKKITQTELDEQLIDLQVQLDTVDKDLEVSQQEFEKFLVENDLKNTDLVNTPYAKQYLETTMELEKDKSLISIYTLEMKKIDETIADTNNLIAKEKDASSSGLTQDDLSVQILLLQEQISELRSREINTILIQQEEDLYKIAQEQYANGEISRAELTTAQYQFELAVAQYADTTDIDLLEAQIEELRKTDVVGYGESLSYSDYLKELRLRRVDAELNLLAAQESYNTNLTILQDLEKTLEDYPTKLQEYLALNGTITSLRAERRGLEKMLTQTRIAIDQGYSDFLIISDATPPVYPSGSNKKLIAAAVAILVFLFGFVIIFALVFFDRRLRSAGEAALKLKERVVAVIPAVRKEEKAFPSAEQESIHIERFRMLARPVRKRYASQGATYLVTSTTDYEGKTLTVTNLAAVYGRQDERVLIIEAQIRKHGKGSDYERIMFPDAREQGVPGLGEYLSYTAEGLKEIVQHTALPGVDLIPIRDKAVVPDLLQSGRMKELMQEIQQTYSVVLIEAPPIESSVDAEILAQYCDTVLYVVASAGAGAGDTRNAIRRIKDTNTDFFGIVLTGIHKSFL